LILSGCESNPSDNRAGAGSELSHPLSEFSNKVLQDSLKASGNRLTLVNFYATWCRPCVKEIPDLLALQQKYPNALRLMMVSIDDREVVASVLPQILVSHQIPFATWYTYGDTPDASTLITSLYPSWNSSIPLSLLYDPNGNLLQVITGQIDPEKMNQYIQSLTL
jgi:thiol-disulfide isomerase/thioredoxin